jgi:hypothetical protein
VCTPTPQWIDVQLKKEGFVFRFFIHQQKEIVLMSKSGKISLALLMALGGCSSDHPLPFSLISCRGSRRRQRGPA